MEFFKIIDVSTTEEEIQNLLVLRELENFCGTIFPLGEGKDICKIGGVWGEFTLRRDPIMGGVRFAMLDCPNALAWTVTTGYPPAREKVVIHLTINRERKQEEFIDEIKEFLSDMDTGLKSFLK